MVRQGVGMVSKEMVHLVGDKGMEKVGHPPRGGIS